MNQENMNCTGLPQTTEKGEVFGSTVLYAEQVKSFDFNDESFRVVIDNGEPLFVAEDVCKILGYRNPRKALAKHCKYSAEHCTLSSFGGLKKTNFINEHGLYRLAFASKKEEAEDFTNFVYENVLRPARKARRHTVKQQIRLHVDADTEVWL